MSPELPFHLAWVGLSFLCGALPFSAWIPRLLAGQDVRRFGDANPGATNALKAAGWPAGLAALMLDVTKGALPVGLACQAFGWGPWWMLPVALAPLLGSAFSPFLGFRGGKSLAVTLGVWIGLTLWEAPLVILVTLTLAFLVQSSSGRAVAAAILATGLYLWLAHRPSVYFALLAAQAALILWRFRADLAGPLRLRAWLLRGRG